MKLKKSLVTLTAATAVALAGVPAAHAEDAPVEPAATAEAPAGSTTADNGADEAPAGSSADNGTEEETASGSSKESGALQSSENPELQASVDGSFGWDEDTSGFDKFLTIFEGAVRIAKIIVGIPDLSTLTGSVA